MGTTLVMTFIIMTLFFIAMSIQILAGRKKEFTHTCAHSAVDGEHCQACTCQSHDNSKPVLRTDLLNRRL